MIVAAVTDDLVGARPARRQHRRAAAKAHGRRRRRRLTMAQQARTGEGRRGAGERHRLGEGEFEVDDGSGMQ